jgi:hypothetical protein
VDRRVRGRVAGRVRSRRPGPRSTYYAT